MSWQHEHVDENGHKFYGSRHVRAETIMTYLIISMVFGIVFLLFRFIVGGF